MVKNLSKSTTEVALGCAETQTASSPRELRKRLFVYLNYMIRRAV
jgi:hypothetical protein